MDTESLLDKLTELETLVLTDGETVSEILVEVDTVWLTEFDSEVMLVAEDTVENRRLGFALRRLVDNDQL